jgi:hypothetical protein
MMPRYFFDIDDGAEHKDEIGRVLEDGPILRAEALKVVAALTVAEAEDARETTLVLSVRDEAGVPVLRVRVVCQVEAA